MAPSFSFRCDNCRIDSVAVDHCHGLLLRKLRQNVPIIQTALVKDTVSISGTYRGLSAVENLKMMLH
jgi:hypothetical protein